MKRINLMLATFFVVSLSTSVGADWRSLVTDAHTQADLILQGTVQSVDDQTAVDGGHVYRLKVTSQTKGAAADEILVRMGGFFYTVQLEVDDSVLVFLKSVNGGRFSPGAPAYLPIEAESLRPMVFMVSRAGVKPVDDRLGPEFDKVTGAEIDDLLSSLEP